ncbi:hypothetical protein CsSME_00051569 [Camellia sinensis var. sinensis]
MKKLQKQSQTLRIVTTNCIWTYYVGYLGSWYFWSKAVTPPMLGPSELPLIGGSNKKLKDEWSCALYHVSATSKQGSNEHLQGRKHKAQEARLKTLRKGKNYAIGLSPKKSTKLAIQITKTIHIKISKLLHANKTGKKLLQQ